MSESSEYYHTHPEAKRKKAATDKKINARPAQKAKRRELGKENYKRGGSSPTKDLSHTSKGLVYKPKSVNRGSKSDTAGDKRARGKK